MLPLDARAARNKVGLSAGRDTDHLMTLRLRGSGKSGRRLRALAGWLALALVVAPVTAPLMGCSYFNKDDDLIADSQPTSSITRAFSCSTTSRTTRKRRRNSTKWTAKIRIRIGRASRCSCRPIPTIRPGIYRLHQFGQTLHDAASRQSRSRLRAIPDRLVLLRSDPRRQSRPGARRQGDRALEEVVAQISGHRICQRRQEKNRHGARPARRQGDGGRPLLPEEARFHRRDQPLQGGGDAIPDHAPRRGSARAADRSLYLARHHRRGADRRRGARPQFPGQPMVQGRL